MTPANFDTVPGSPSSFASLFLSALAVDHTSNQPSSSSGAVVQQPTPSFTPPTSRSYRSIGVQATPYVDARPLRTVYHVQQSHIKKPFAYSTPAFRRAIGEEASSTPSLSTFVSRHSRNYTSQVARKSTGSQPRPRLYKHPKAKPTRQEIIAKLERQGIVQDNIITLEQETAQSSGRVISWRGICVRMIN